MMLPLPAQNAAPSAAQLAAAVDHHYNALHRLRVNFTESYAGMGMDRHENGVLLLEKPGRMRWNYAEPAGKVFVLDVRYQIDRKIKGATHIPLGDLETRLADLPRDREIVTYCS